MHYALLFTLLLPMQQQPPASSATSAIENAESLVSMDWGDELHVLSLRPGEKWNKGTAWFFTELTSTSSAWKGDYSLSYRAKDDTLLISIGFSRKYALERRQANQNGKWQLDPRYEPKGMVLELALENKTIPTKEITVSVTDSFFSDENGNPITRRSAPYGLIQKLQGQGDVRKVYLDCVQQGATLTLQQEEDAFDGEPGSLPPGYQTRTSEKKAKKVVTNYRPDTKPATGHEKLWDEVKRAHKEKDGKRVLELVNAILILEPDNVDVYSFRAWAELVLDRQDDAIVSYGKAIQLSPQNPLLFKARALILVGRERFEEAAKDYEAMINLNPQDSACLNLAAWFFATCSSDNVRNGKKALGWAQQACKLTEYKNSLFLDTLAAAYATSGEFKKAVLWQTEAIDRLKEEKIEDDSRTQMEKEMNSRLKLFEQRKSFVKKDALRKHE